ncbi:MAG: stage III sporulation protein AA, partial [Lachnospiraceae bacterium]|nr:stage III sporulation protein AA [Lachnospiraceae bacterium]
MEHITFDLQEKKEQVFHMLSTKIRSVFEKENYDFFRLQDIRMRVGKPLLVVYGGKEYLVTMEGEFRRDVDQSVKISEEDIRESLEYISNYSMYAFEKEIKQGYLTVAGGHMVGLAGKVVWERGAAKSIRYISFINIRLAHEVKGCADRLFPYLYGEHGLCHTLLISSPGCGKTTLLRDIVRQISDGTGRRPGMTVGVVDERSEIAACYQGTPQNDLGSRTDVLDDCPKSEGMMMLVRSMAPQVIAVDEIGARKDVEAIRYIMNSGVKLLATIH